MRSPQRKIYRALVGAVAAMSCGAITQAATWDSAVTGDWSDGSKWTAGASPTTTETATIAAAGAVYTVTTLNPTTIGSLVVNSADATLQTFGNLTVATSFSFLSGSLDGTVTFAKTAFGGQTLTFGGQATASGEVHLQSSSLIVGSIPLGITVRQTGDVGLIPSLIIKGGQSNAGTLTFDGNAPLGSSPINVSQDGAGGYTNSGTINLGTYVMFSGGYTNTGTIDATSLATSYFDTMTLSAGALNITNGLSFGRLYFNGGTINGTVTVLQSLTMGPQTVASGTFKFFNTSGTVSGNILAGMSVYHDTGSGTQTMTVFGGQENDGTLTIDSLSNASAPRSTFNIAGSGVYTNNGTINMTEGGLTAATRTVSTSVSATLVNAGTMNVNARTDMRAPLINTGTISIAAGKLLTVARTMTLAGGSLAIDGSFSTSNAVTYTGGSISGTITMDGTISKSLRFGGQTAGSGTFLFSGTDSSIGSTLANADVPGGVNIISRAIQTTLSPTMTVLAGSTNRGTITLDAATTVTAASGGAISISGSGAFTNAGTINLNAGSSGGNTRTLQGAGTTLINAAGATINLNGAGTSLTATFQADVQNDGTFRNTGATANFQGAFTNNGVYISDPAVNNFDDLVVGTNGYLQATAGDSFNVGGSFFNNSTNLGQWGVSGAKLSFTAAATHTVSVSGSGKVQWGQVEIGDGATAIFQDGDSGNPGGVYATELILPTVGGVPDLSNFQFDHVTLYFDPTQASNAYLLSYYNGLSPDQQFSSPIQPGTVPEPVTVLPLLAGFGLLRRRRRMIIG